VQSLFENFLVSHPIKKLPSFRFIFFFLCGLFHGPVSVADNVASKDGIMGE
jgi:hypothetical protein